MSLLIENGSECYVTYNAIDHTGVPYTPTSVSYQVWDSTTQTQIVTETAVAPQQTATITLSATVNTIQGTSLPFDQRVVTVKLGIPGGTYENLVSTYTIQNSFGTP